ncbi:MAG: energy-coupling factor ABC transporter substrate-binding protein [Clostridia bacterium]|nr:energy-coupling factor ABC transporter substrate-binding protein [Clostridia bacterium]
MNLKRNSLLLMGCVIFLAIAPLLMLNNADFGGADEAAKAAILEISPDYEPWFDFIWEPPSGEIESLLFALQAAIGTGFIGYYIWMRRQKARESER